MKYPLHIPNAIDVAFIGRKGSRKTTRILEFIKPHTRLVVFDIKGEYPTKTKVFNPRDLAKAMRSKSFSISYVPRGRLNIPRGKNDWTHSNRRVEHLEFCSQVVKSFGRCLFVNEEMAMTTTPNYAPPTWIDLVLTGKDIGVLLVGVSQMPQMIDKNFLSNAGVIYCGALGGENEVKYMRGKMGKDVANSLMQMKEHYFIKWEASNPTKTTMLRPNQKLK